MDPTFSNTTVPQTPLGGHSPFLPSGLAEIWAFVLSFSALRDWLKLIVLGGVLETCRRFGYLAWQSFVDSFFLTAHFEQEDESYDWMMVWLSKHPAWQKARDIQISTRSYGVKGPTSVLIEGEDETNNIVGGIEEKTRLAYLPSFDLTHSMRFRGHWLRVTRTRRYLDEGCTRESLKISLLTRSHKLLNVLLLEAKTAYTADQQHRVTIYIADQYNNWRRTGTRPKRPLKSIILDPGVKDMLLRDAREFMASEQWYAERGIPFRRGYLLYGAPGSGKTSLIHSIAGELGLDIYVISLSKRGLDDSTLGELIADLPAKSIALMEDIDAAFHHSITRESGSKDGEKSTSVDSAVDLRGVTLSGLLGAIDGVAAHEGRLLFATTNHVDHLDPALSRPGRMDVHVEFKLASKCQAAELFKCFFPASEQSDPHEDEPEVSDSHATTSDDQSDDESSMHSLLANEHAAGTVTPASSVDTASNVGKEDIHDLYTDATLGPPQPPRLATEKLAKLAARFAQAIPDRQFSMASLQGHLMGYKTRPEEAVLDAPVWVAREMKLRKERQSRTPPEQKQSGNGSGPTPLTS